MCVRRTILAIALFATSPAFAQNAKVSTLTPATLPLTGTELFYVVQGGVSKNITFSAFQAAASGVSLATPNTWTALQTFSAGIAYGGVTLANSVTGSGSMVLSNAPTLTGKLTVNQTNSSIAINALETADTSWSVYFPHTVGIFATEGNDNAIVGAELNNLAASTNSLPTGVIGFGKVTTTGNQVFGVYGLGEVWGATGVAIAAEFTARNKSGVAADTNLPPNEGIGTTTVVPNALQVTCGGLNGCSIGVAISPEGGSSSTFNTAEYIYGSGYSTFGLFIDAAATGNQTAAVLKGNGNGEILHMLVTGAAQPNNTVMDIENASNVEEFYIKQNGAVLINGPLTLPGTPTSAGSGGLNVCIDTSGNLYKKASCP
jgi:autotransporter-associated beta strand protein